MNKNKSSIFSTRPFQLTKFSAVQGVSFPAQSVNGEIVCIPSFMELNLLITQEAWSPAIFKDNHRRNDNFLRTDFMSLDFDENASLANVSDKLICLDLDASITLTRNHGKVKQRASGNKPASDRFRVVIPLEEPITSKEDYEATWKFLQGHFPEIDGQCKDPARFYFASINGVWAGV